MALFCRQSIDLGRCKWHPSEIRATCLIGESQGAPKAVRALHRTWPVVQRALA
jgi:hypothetical protein